MRRSFVVVSIVALGSIGCSEKTIEKTEVSGQVTYNGQPVETGMIHFKPKGSTKGPMAAGSIMDGKYTVTATGGVPLGTHSVEITGWLERPDLKKADVPFAPTPRDFYIPEKYNKKSELEVTVEAGGNVTKDFQLEGPPRKTPPGK